MRIVIDLQGAQSASRFRGIGRYSLSLASGILRNAGKHEIWIVLNAAFPESVLSIRHELRGLIPENRIRIFEAPTPVMECQIENRWRVNSAELVREAFIRQLQPDMVLISSLFEGYGDNATVSVAALDASIPTAVILYDLIPLLNPEDYLANSTYKDFYFRKINSLKQANLLLAISEASRQEAVANLDWPPKAVVNISAAADARFKPMHLSEAEIGLLQNKYGITKKLILCAPGGFDSRKNFENLFKAYSLLKPDIRTNYQFAMVGNIDEDRKGYLHKLMQDNGIGEHEVLITGYVPDEDLVALYNVAKLFVFASKHEGFGLPVLEAMSCGLPTIGSNCTSIPEVLGNADALFNPASPQEICKKIEQVLTDEAFANELAKVGLERAGTFSWNNSARKALVEIEKVCAQANFQKKKENASVKELVEAIAAIGQVGVPSNIELAKLAQSIAFNQGGDGVRQLLLDVSEIVQRDAKSGIQRVVRSILNELLLQPPSDLMVRPIYFDGANYRYANKLASNLKGVASSLSDDLVQFCQDDVYLALDLNAHLTAVVHNLHLELKAKGIKLYFIVYDILLVQHPEWWPEGTSLVFESWLKSICQVSTGLICISRAVADEVEGWIKQNPPQRLDSPVVESFHLGADINNSLPSTGLPPNAEAIIAQITSKPSFLMVSTIEPRKGHAQTLHAFDLLWQQGIDVNLVIVGKQGWLVEQLVFEMKAHGELNRRLYWLEGISDEYLEKVYKASTCLIVASEGEGFGLPLIEAAQHGKPIIARNIPVLKEIAGEHAYYFEGMLASNLAAAIKEWLNLFHLNKHPVSSGMKFLNWQESAKQLLSKISWG